MLNYFLPGEADIHSTRLCHYSSQSTSSTTSMNLSLIGKILFHSQNQCMNMAILVFLDNKCNKQIQANRTINGYEILIYQF